MNYREIKEEIIKNSPEGGYGGKAPCPRCGIKIEFVQHLSELQCPICNPIKP